MADVQSSFRNWSATVGSNSPTSSTTIGTGLAPNFQQIQATLRTELGSRSTALTAGATTDLSTKDEGTILVSNAATVTITSFGTLSVGIKKLVTFTNSGTLTLTHNATSLILPSSANITVADGDSLLAESLGSGNWKVHAYYRASGLPVVSSTAPFIDSTPLLKGSADATKLVAFEVDGLTTGTTRTVTVPDKNGTLAMTSDIPTVQANATSSDVITRTSSTLNVTPASLQGIISSGTSQATTSGTSKDYTVPSWAKMMMVMLNGVSTNGTSNLIVQIGHTTPETSGYLGAENTSSGATSQQFSTGFCIKSNVAAASVSNGIAIIALADSATNTWAMFGGVGLSNTTQAGISGGSKAVSGVVDIVRITTINGTDTFDAGLVNVLFF